MSAINAVALQSCQRPNQSKLKQSSVTCVAYNEPKIIFAVGARRR